MLHSLVWPAALHAHSTSSGSHRALGLVCRSLAGRLMQWRFSLLMLWEPPDDISDRGQRRMQKRLLSEYTSLGAPFPLDRAAHRAPRPASTGWSRTCGSTRRHSYPRAGRLVADCRRCLSTDLGSRSPTIACPPRAANCRRASCVRPGSTRGVSESDIRRTSSHHLRVEREGVDGANTFIIARGLDAGVDLYSAVLSSRHSVENPEGSMALDSESSHGACFCTRKHATSTHSAWAFSLAVMYRSFPEVDNEREVPKVSFKHAFIDEGTSSINCTSSDARF